MDPFSDLVFNIFFLGIRGGVARSTLADANETRIRGGVARSTLADANETRTWRIYRDFSLYLSKTARALYAKDSFDNTIYALDTTTIELCLSLFP